ncbi:MAG: hypothetical protein M3069_32180 [Chloroflexota bacterium]|nr:hypothetical protein [Chloroflexota bacterium]
MSKGIFTRWRGVAVLLVLGACTLVVGSSQLPPAEAAPQAVSDSQKATVAAHLEKLHARALSRSKADEDDKAVTLAKNSALTLMSPERAAELARIAAGGGSVTWVSRHTDATGKSYYHVRIGPANLPGSVLGRVQPLAELHVDAETGNISDGSGDNLNQGGNNR